MKRMKTSLSLALVLGLTFSAPTSSHALLTELVVGGGIILQLAGVMSEAIPQITALSGAVSALVSGGQEIVGTVKKIIDLVTPGKAKKGKPAPKKPKPPAEPPAGDTPALDEILADDPPAGESGTPPGTGEGPGLLEMPELKPAKPGSGPSRDLAGQLTELSKAFLRQQGLVTAMEAADPAQKEALQAGLRTLSERYERQVEGLATDLVAAGKAGDQKAIEAFVAEGKRLSDKARAGLVPLFERLSERGTRFDSLHGEAPPAPEPLPALVKSALEALQPTAPGAPQTGTGRRPLVRRTTR